MTRFPITDGGAPGAPRRVRRCLVPAAIGLVGLLTLASAASAQPCAGDCDGDGRVTANEILLAGQSACPAADTDGNATISEAELSALIRNLFAGCRPGGPLPDEWQEAFDAADVGWMMSGWGPGDGTLWLVGGHEDAGAIVRFDAQGWRVIDPGVSVPLLNWVHGTSASDVFAASSDGRILHYDGSAWRVQQTPVGKPVWGLWAVAPDDVWAVGGNNLLGGPPFVLHYDGAQWSLAPTPTLQRPGVFAFFKVWGSGPNDVYAVGQNGAILHWDGTQFSEQGAGIGKDLIGIWGNGPNDITVVGGRGTAEMAHFNGSSWQRAPASALPGLNGVWTRRPDVAHAVGVAGTVLRLDPRSLTVLEQIEVPTTFDLHSVFGDASGQLVAMGANFDYPEQGVVLIRKLGNDD